MGRKEWSHSWVSSSTLFIMTVRSQKQVLGREGVLGKLSFRGKAGPPKYTVLSGASPQALFRYPVFSPRLWVCKRFVAWKQNNYSYEQVPWRKVMAGPRFLANWMSRYIFCRCLDAALSHCKKKKDNWPQVRVNLGLHLVFQFHHRRSLIHSRTRPHSEESASSSEDPLTLDRPFSRSTPGQN